MGIAKDKYGNLIIDEKEAAVVRNVFLWYLRGDSCNEIKHKLEQRGIETVSGKRYRRTIWSNPRRKQEGLILASISSRNAVRKALFF